MFSFEADHSHQRLHIFTGKGGTGKTTLSLAYALRLKTEGLKVLYIPFDQICEKGLCRKFKIPFYTFDKDEIIIEYVSEKLRSKILGNWICETSFFKAIYQMLPGIMYIVLLGHLLKKLEENENLHICLDLPSTGHALTLFEAPQTWGNIFERGPLFEDMKRIKKHFWDQTQTELFICTLPDHLPWIEAQELEANISKLDFKHAKFIFNNVFSELPLIQLTSETFPEILKKKIEAEKNLIATLTENKKIKWFVPFFPEKSFGDSLEKIAETMSLSKEKRKGP